MNDFTRIYVAKDMLREKSGQFLAGVTAAEAVAELGAQVIAFVPEAEASSKVSAVLNGLAEAFDKHAKSWRNLCARSTDSYKEAEGCVLGTFCDKEILNVHLERAKRDALFVKPLEWLPCDEGECATYAGFKYVVTTYRGAPCWSLRSYGLGHAFRETKSPEEAKQAAERDYKYRVFGALRSNEGLSRIHTAQHVLDEGYGPFFQWDQSAKDELGGEVVALIREDYANALLAAALRHLEDYFASIRDAHPHAARNFEVARMTVANVHRDEAPLDDLIARAKAEKLYLRPLLWLPYGDQYVAFHAGIRYIVEQGGDTLWRMKGIDCDPATRRAASVEGAKRAAGEDYKRRVFAALGWDEVPLDALKYEKTPRPILKSEIPHYDEISLGILKEPIMRKPLNEIKSCSGTDRAGNAADPNWMTQLDSQLSDIGATIEEIGDPSLTEAYEAFSDAVESVERAMARMED